MPPRPPHIRALHTSTPVYLPPPANTRPSLSGLASLFSNRPSNPTRPPGFPSSSSANPATTPSASTAANDAVRNMMDVLARNRPEEVRDDRKRVAAQTLIRPSDLTQSSLYAARKPGAKPPLLGPPKKIAMQVDPFYQSSQSPVEHTLNPNFSLAFVNPLGRIRGRAETGLTRRSQRMVGKMVRRARAMGLISKFSDRIAISGYGSTSGGRLR